MGESVVDQLDGPAREKEEEKIAGRRPGLWLSSVVIRVLLLLSLPDLGGSSSTTNRLPNFRELIPIKAIYKSSPTNPPTTRAASLNILRLPVHHNRNPPPPNHLFLHFSSAIFLFFKRGKQNHFFSCLAVVFSSLMFREMKENVVVGQQLFEPGK
jgi:hypothetical protein